MAALTGLLPDDLTWLVGQCLVFVRQKYFSLIRMIFVVRAAQGPRKELSLLSLVLALRPE
ncbi:MAG TPA: hypothetical protein EYM43_01960 [Alphaproteobacteria bacterium]|nr:hypothetical protein [Alphaproteobacteria bacterium]